MPDETLFISDLHLTLERPEITKRFINFLAHRATEANKLYILGDLFDSWIGDDDISPPIKTIKKNLKTLTQTGTQVFYLHGNRDFLIGQLFSQETGVGLLDEYSTIDLYGTQTLLTHGDLLCTDDHAYQNFRLTSRTQAWQNNVLSKPLILRLLVARWYRFRSFLHKRKKTDAIMDVNQDTVNTVLKKYQCSCLIHGHTHRHAIHDFDLDNTPAQRFVLPEWQKEKTRLLCWTAEGYHLEDIA